MNKKRISTIMLLSVSLLSCSVENNTINYATPFGITFKEF